MRIGKLKYERRMFRKWVYLNKATRTLRRRTLDIATNKIAKMNATAENGLSLSTKTKYIFNESLFIMALF
jgi:hypothetical protein